jgi:hypothetical protein
VDEMSQKKAMSWTQWITSPETRRYVDQVEIMEGKKERKDGPSG